MTPDTKLSILGPEPIPHEDAPVRCREETRSAGVVPSLVVGIRRTSRRLDWRTENGRRLLVFYFLLAKLNFHPDGGEYFFQ